MFIYNIQIKKSQLLKIILILASIFLLVLAIISAIRIFHSSFQSSSSTCLPQQKVVQIDAQNYTNVLKAVHENLSNYIGQTIQFEGYVYRVQDLAQDQFVLARDMVIDSQMQTLVVGFLCHSKKANNFNNQTWVSITGKIEKGDYHGEIPIIEVQKIETTEKPSDPLVYPPDQSYLPTTALIGKKES